MSMENSKQQMRRKKEDAALNKLLIWFGVAIVYEVIALLLKRFYINFRSNSTAEVYFAYGLSRVFSVLQWILPILTVAAVVWLVLNKRSGKAVRAPLLCTGLGVLLSFTVILAYRFFDTGVMILGVVAPVMAVLGAGLLPVPAGIFLQHHPGRRRHLLSVDLSQILSTASQMDHSGIRPGLGPAGGGGGFGLEALSNQGQMEKSYDFLPKGFLCAHLSDRRNHSPDSLGRSCCIRILPWPTMQIFVLVTWLFCLAVYYTVRMM